MVNPSPRIPLRPRRAGRWLMVVGAGVIAAGLVLTVAVRTGSDGPQRASAGPNPDVGFVASVNSAAPNMYTDAQAIALGHQLCDSISTAADAHQRYAQEETQLGYRGLDKSNADVILDAAIGAYCPADGLASITGPQ